MLFQKEKLNFQSVDRFRASLTNSLLKYQCKLNFACVFNVCICVHFILYLLYCHINYYLHNIVSGQLVFLLLKIDDDDDDSGYR